VATVQSKLRSSLALGLCSACLLVAAGCGGATAASTSSSPIPTAKTFTDAVWHFSVTYDASKIMSPNALSILASAGAHTVLFGDKDSADHFMPPPFGSQPGGGPSGYFAVSVSRLSGGGVDALSLTDATYRMSHNSAAGAMSLYKKIVASGVASVVFNGLSGYRDRLSWKGGALTTYELYRKPFVYELQLAVGRPAQASNRQALTAALHSFKAD